ncbi:50S ribosomal protein L13 [Candidatus Aerophobetes bacterium]|uniref:Large ribosomal subunit protein uL13 n=1 Tax=Aerophobetes bacterium TaxID=2030807 RepID=A0A7V0QR89_UNCAE|nr:50S ribosomal protein L13 [Candidatus Aerophobetes bacterium]HDN85005.1 50S ribosomal protein L13 [Candidatus Aerophobetes bacterium]
MKTFIPKKDEIVRKWYLIDADGKILGRMATRIARILSGKDKPIYTPHLDTGDFVVVINARKVRVTGEKYTQKIYYHHSGYPGGLKKRTFEELMKKKPEEIILRAVKGMLPKNRLGRKMLKKLKVYPDADHPHQAQNPQPIDV